VFSGIVESEARVLRAWAEQKMIRVEVEKPSSFNDLRVGDSVAVNGVCLTVERFSESRVQFALGAETLHITGWTVESLEGQPLNLERSLRLGDRIHGHLVAGHVDAMGTVESRSDLGGSVDLVIRFPAEMQPYLWKKGSWAVNGVSLTINKVEALCAWQCLIPETLKATNLGRLRPGDRVCLEADWMARAIANRFEATGKGRE
jgi:riboflavin synthase